MLDQGEGGYEPREGPHRDCVRACVVGTAQSLAESRAARGPGGARSVSRVSGRWEGEGGQVADRGVRGASADAGNASGTGGRLIELNGVAGRAGRALDTSEIWLRWQRAKMRAFED